MMDAETARVRSAGVRAGKVVQANAAARRQAQMDKDSAASLGAHMIEGLEVAISVAIFNGSTRAYNYTHENSRSIQCRAFHDHIIPHFEPLGYKLEWEYKDDYGVDEPGRVTFGVTVTW